MRKRTHRCLAMGLRSVLFLTLLAAIVIGVCAKPGAAQSLNWEGQTGVFVTPLAYSVLSGDHGFGMPVVAYHYLDAGQVLGGFHQVSITIGAFNRLESGTREIFIKVAAVPV